MGFGEQTAAIGLDADGDHAVDSRREIHEGELSGSGLTSTEVSRATAALDEMFEAKRTKKKD